MPGSLGSCGPTPAGPGFQPHCVRRRVFSKNFRHKRGTTSTCQRPPSGSSVSAPLRPGRGALAGECWLRGWAGGAVARRSAGSLPHCVPDRSGVQGGPSCSSTGRLAGRVRHVQRDERGAGLRGGTFADAGELGVGGGAAAQDVPALPHGQRRPPGAAGQAHQVPAGQHRCGRAEGREGGAWTARLESTAWTQSQRPAPSPSSCTEAGGHGRLTSVASAFTPSLLSWLSPVAPRVPVGPPPRGLSLQVLPAA